VTVIGGCARVNEILSTSRSIGDIYLKQLIIPDPEVRPQRVLS
jgi:hypothetical protein